ncbi:MAG: hypothetical protein H6933_11040 [Burkholderiaceae bacterium]|nr:hypothetical protein [Burkholderiaceae bacterium]
MFEGVSTAVWLVIIIFLFVLAVLWFLLPFAVFGVKKLLMQLIAEQKKTNDLLLKAIQQSEQER